MSSDSDSDSGTTISSSEDEEQEMYWYECVTVFCTGPIWNNIHLAYPSDSAGPDPTSAIWVSGSGADFSWQSWHPGIKIKTWNVTSLTNFKPRPSNAQMISQASSHGLNHGQRAPSSGTCQTAPWMHTWLFRVLFFSSDRHWCSLVCTCGQCEAAGLMFPGLALRCCGKQLARKGAWSTCS